MKKKLLSVLIFIACFSVMMAVNFGLFSFSSIYLILISAIVGLVYFGVQVIREKGEKK